jgi:hypothetical protein
VREIRVAASNQRSAMVGPPDATKTGGPVSRQLKLRPGSTASLASLSDDVTVATGSESATQSAF